MVLESVLRIFILVSCLKRTRWSSALDLLAPDDLLAPIPINGVEDETEALFGLPRADLPAVRHVRHVDCHGDFSGRALLAYVRLLNLVLDHALIVLDVRVVGLQHLVAFIE